MSEIRGLQPHPFFIALTGLAWVIAAAAAPIASTRAATGSTQATVALSSTGPDSVFIDDPTPVQVVFTARNNGTQATPTSALRLTWPAVSINGAPGYPALVAIDAGGGAVDLSQVGTGEVSVTLPPIAPGVNHAVALSLHYPAGIVDASLHVISGLVTVAPDNTATASRAWTLFGSRQLQVQASADQATVAVGGELSFTGRHRSTGTAITRHTYSFGAIPAHTRFRYAELAPARQLLCVGPPADQGLPTQLSQFSASLIEATFTPGLQSTEGWICPQGNATSWVAVALDDMALTPPLFATGVDESWRLHLLHDGSLCRNPVPDRQSAAVNPTIFFQLAILAESLVPSESGSASTSLRLELFVDGFETDPPEPAPMPNPCR